MQKASLLSIAVLLCLGLIAQNSSAGSCYALGNGTPAYQNAVRPPVTDPFWQRYLIEEPILQSAFGVRARMYLINANNAFAEPQGNVYLGLPLYQAFNRELGVQYAFQGGAFILYHEYAHHFQFRMIGSNLGGGPIPELQADMLAGYWAGVRIREQTLGPQDGRAPETLENVKRAAFAAGDYAFDDPGHHGTPQQRRQSITIGLDAGLQQSFGGRTVAFQTRATDILNWSAQQCYRLVGGRPGGR